MKRVEFIASVGKGLFLACSGACMLSSCSTGNDQLPAPPTGDVSVDITKLSAVGDQIIKNSVLFFRISTGNSADSFVATQALCPHQGGRLVWVEQDNLIECVLHFAEFQKDGSVVQGPQGSSGNVRPLAVYPLSLTGDTLTASV
ncbi:Rieske [Christiangramia fulva]|uniref:Rieske n=1 Tax=Christiangramia fulva TaxID=2126553 RepID=A0A2R3Z4L7_9FLAO|nr:Rieske (2Fe-2S) protein [Christiangramia fulva]AVR45209.1 Rieske [Christiangramia fulva]